MKCFQFNGKHAYTGKCKNKTDANNDRPNISDPLIYPKSVEKVLLNHVNKQLESIQPSFPNAQQHVVRKELSCTTAAYNLQ